MAVRIMPLTPDAVDAEIPRRCPTFQCLSCGAVGMAQGLRP